jgi:2-aminoadipate transaminase
VEEFKRACEYVLDNHGAQALQYGTTEGYLPLREMISRHTNRLGIGVNPDNILITSGSQQALICSERSLLTAAIELSLNPPPTGCTSSRNAYDAEYIPVPCDEYGMKMDSLEQALRAGPKFIYVLPNFQNPSGVTLSMERRKKLSNLLINTEFPSLKTIPTASYVMKVKTFLQSNWLMPIYMSKTAITQGMLFT